MVKETLYIDGMHCNSCSQKIEDALEDKVDSIKVSYSKGVAHVEFNSSKISLNRIKEIIRDTGYNVSTKNKFPPSNHSSNSPKNNKSIDYVGLTVMTASIIFLLVVLYYLLTNLGLNFDFPEVGDDAGLLILFFIGLLTGFHCISMCGAFVVSYTAKNAINGHKGYLQHILYGGSKMISYSIIGGLLGFVGGVISFSVGLRGMVAIFAGIFMIFYGLSMMGLKFFRRFQFNPKFLTKFTYKASKNAKGPYLAPLVTGLLSGLFIACGPLQAMYLYAMGTGGFFSGFTSLMAFGLGTIPVMLVFAGLATKISQGTTKKIIKFSAILVIILGIIMLNRGLTVIGSPYSFEAVKGVIGSPQAGLAEINTIDGYQEINMKVDASGWTPDTFSLKKGVPVKWNIDVEQLTGCNKEIIVKDYDLDIKLKKGLNVVEFTPTKTGTVRWSCWMGMIPGSFIVTDSGEATTKQLESSKPEATGGCSAGGESCGSASCGASSGGSCGCGG